ncbi:hypothetical protein ACFYOV_19130 [Streptomyces sp. NPDC005931]|uniref:hypothetical protein n=1 Tax=Streptomyces sp. NPDC005931 TaxID=3364737 RepID=UPI0036876506
MAHVEAAHLVELALGHPVPGDGTEAQRHIARCEHCRGELARLTRVVAAARGIGAPDLPAAPPEQVWSHIQRELLRDVQRGQSRQAAAGPARTAPASPPDEDAARPVSRTALGACGSGRGGGHGVRALVVVLAAVAVVRWSRRAGVHRLDGRDAGGGSECVTRRRPRG